MNFEISELRKNTIWQLYRIRPHIQLDPDYQRLSGIWTLDKRQLLGQFWLEDLYRHVELELEMMAEVDGSHTSCSQLAVEHARPEGLVALERVGYVKKGVVFERAGSQERADLSIAIQLCGTPSL